MRTLLLTCCLVLASCGGNADRPRVRIANVGIGLQTYTMPITLADKLGYYKEEGLDVTLENLPSSSKALQSLIGGSVDAASIVYQQTIQIAAEGQQVRSFFIVNRRSSSALAISPAASGRIHRAEDLKGALIGVSSLGSAPHQWINYYLGAHGIGQTGFRTLSIGQGSSALAAIESGRVDAAVLGGGDHFHLLKRHPDVRILLDSGTAEGMKASYGSELFAGGTLSAKREWLDRNPDTARRLTRALQRTLQWVSTHTPQEIRDSLPASFRSPDAAVDLEIIDWGRAMYTADGKMPQGVPEAMKLFLDATIDNVRNANIDLSATWTNEFIPAAK